MTLSLTTSFKETQSSITEFIKQAFGTDNIVGVSLATLGIKIPISIWVGATYNMYEKFMEKKNVYVLIT